MSETTEKIYPMKDALFFLSYNGIHLDNPALHAVFAEFGLADRDTITERELGQVLYALAETMRDGLMELKVPQAASYARLMRLASGVVDVVAHAQ